MKRGENKAVPLFLWGLTPLAIILAQILIEIFTPPAYLAPLHTEGGPHETLQFLIISPCVLLAAWLAYRAEAFYLKILFAACALGCLYIAGEEVSWGQHIFGWVTPEFWSMVNDQNETNLHNTSSWLDQKPRLLLFIGCIVGGLIIPALRRWRPAWLPQRFAAIYPSDILVPTALGVLLPYSAQAGAEIFYNGRLFERVSEVQELYIYYFIFLYLLDSKMRILPKESYENQKLAR